MPLCFDLNEVINRIQSPEGANDFYWRLRSIPCVKLLIVSFVKSTEGAIRHLEEVAPWFSIVMRFDGIIFTFNTSRTRTIDVEPLPWRGLRNIIKTDGNKGQVISLFGRPTILFDDKWSNLDHH